MLPFSTYTTAPALTENPSSMVTTRPASASFWSESGSIGPFFLAAATNPLRERMTVPVNGNQLRGAVMGPKCGTVLQNGRDRMEVAWCFRFLTISLRAVQQGYTGSEKL